MKDDILHKAQAAKAFSSDAMRCVVEKPTLADTSLNADRIVLDTTEDENYHLRKMIETESEEIFFNKLLESLKTEEHEVIIIADNSTKCCCEIY